jgi:hypothetical protein
MQKLCLKSTVKKHIGTSIDFSIWYTIFELVINPGFSPLFSYEISTILNLFERESPPWEVGKLWGIDLTISISLFVLILPLFEIALYAFETNPIIPSAFLSPPKIGSIAWAL